jgi:hypothetical protein
MRWQNINDCYLSLIAAVIERAVADLKGDGPKCRRVEMDQAMSFILSGACEEYCLELGVDYKTVREKAAALYREFTADKGSPERRVT